MEKKEDVKTARPFNFGESPLVKQTEQTTESGFEAVEKKEQGGGQIGGQKGGQIVGPKDGPMLEPARETTMPAGSVYQEPTQNINIPIPSSQHVRLKVISATSRQTMKDMVVQAIGLWLDVQEGKIEIKK
jgi:hypothetical protein